MTNNILEKLDMLGSELSKNSENTNDIEQAIKQLLNKLNPIDTNIDTDIDTINNKINEIEKKVNERINKIEKKDPKIVERHEAIDNIKQQIKTIQAAKNTMESLYTQSSNQIDALCLMGGGAKGYVFPGSYLALHEAGMMDNIKLMSGTSIGAITSCFIACGFNPEDLSGVLSNNSFETLLGKHKFMQLRRDGVGLKTLLSQKISEKFNEALESELKEVNLTKDQKDALQILKDKSGKENCQYTMADLALVTEIYPKFKFKDLLVTAVHADTESLHIFSSVEQTSLIKEWLGDTKDKQDFKKLIEDYGKISDALTIKDLNLINNIIDPIKGLIQLSNAEDKKAFNDLVQKSKRENYQLTKQDINLIKKIISPDQKLIKEWFEKEVREDKVVALGHILTGAFDDICSKTTTPNNQDNDFRLAKADYKFIKEHLEVVQQTIDHPKDFIQSKDAAHKITFKGYKEKFENLIKNSKGQDYKFTRQDFNLIVNIIDLTAYKKYNDKTPQDIEDFNALIKNSQNTDYKFTLDDINLIKKIDHTKDLVLRDDKIFSNVSIVDACMASAALPQVLPNVDINGEKFIDGGMLQNIPFNILNRGDNSLILGFNDIWIHDTIHSNKKQVYNLGWLQKFLMGLLGLSIKKPIVDVTNKALEKMRDENMYHKTIENDTKDISLIGFNRAYKESKEGVLRGYFSTMNNLILYGHHSKAIEIIKKTEESKELKNSGRHQDIAKLDKDIEKLTNEFDEFKQRFEMRKFIFEVIDNTKDRQNTFYTELLEFCNEKENFAVGKSISDIAQTYFDKFQQHRQIDILKKTLNKTGSSQPSDQIRNTFEEIQADLIEKKITQEKTTQGLKSQIDQKVTPKKSWLSNLTQKTKAKSFTNSIKQTNDQNRCTNL